MEKKKYNRLLGKLSFVFLRGVFRFLKTKNRMANTIHEL